MEWKLLTSTVHINKPTFWSFVTKKTKKVSIEVPLDQQIDEVGNIYQKSGAVIAKACQKCGKEFDYTPTMVERKAPVPIYKCTACSFTNGSGDAAFDHKLTTDHKVVKTTVERVVAIEKKLLGSLAHITKTEDDVIILCGECNG